MPRLVINILSILRHAGVGLLVISICGCQLVRRQSHDEEIASNPCLVLALPGSGPYASYATKIRRGAETAVKELAQRGTHVQLENINTEASDWLTRLSALPESCAIVGGPLQDKSYLEARKAGLLNQRAFFAFMQTLAQGDEGKIAWRFFSSPRDQVDALIGFATDQMGIRSYGAFYPSDNYGRRMTEIMETALKKRDMPLQKAAYTPGAPATWAAAAAPLINPRRGEDGRTMVPQTTFEALFVPDSFKNMDQLTTALLKNGEDRLALLGPVLWEQGLAGKQPLKAAKYELAVFPAAWNKAKAPASIRNGDFWSALGYDFVNFGAAVGLAKRMDTALITNRAQRSAPAARALAPIYYDNDGIAHQQMYLFQIGAGGMAPLDPERFRQARAGAATRAALRIQGHSHIDPQTGEVAAPAQRVEDTPVQPRPGEPEESVAPSAGAEPVYQSSPAGQDSHAQPQARPAAQTGSHAPETPLVRQMPVAAPQATSLPPASGGGVMSDTPRPSHKLSLPIRR